MTELLGQVNPAAQGDETLAALDVSVLDSPPDGELDGVRQQPGNAREEVVIDQEVYLAAAPPVPWDARRP